MKDITNDINDLIKMNQRIAKFSPGKRFRTVPVYCVARTGQKVVFTPPEQIPGLLTLVMEKFNSKFQTSQNIQSLAVAFSLFWLGFISIHPFENGNGRTGKEFISKKLTALGYKFNSEALDGLLLKGQLKEDLQALENLFIQNITTKEIL